MATLRRSWPTAALVAVGLAGMALLGDGLWMRAKAELAQVLMNHAWKQTQATGVPQSPWPWADMTPAYALSIPAHNFQSIVFASASGEALAFAPGWMPSTAKPGTEGLSVIAAHRDTHFATLEHVATGDIVAIEDETGHKETFEVAETRVVDANRSGLDRHMPGQWLALTTCWPFGAVTPGEERFVVLARKINASAV